MKRDYVVGCTGKKRFDSFGYARTAASRRNKHDRAHLEPYHCRHCNGFHVGESRRYKRPDRRKLQQPETTE